MNTIQIASGRDGWQTKVILVSRCRAPQSGRGDGPPRTGFIDTADLPGILMRPGTHSSRALAFRINTAHSMSFARLVMAGASGPIEQPATGLSTFAALQTFAEAIPKLFPTWVTRPTCVAR